MKSQFSASEILAVAGLYSNLTDVHWMLRQAAQDARRLDRLEREIKLSRTGVSFDWVPAAEGEPSGYRVMRFHKASEPQKTVRTTFDLMFEPLEDDA